MNLKNFAVCVYLVASTGAASAVSRSDLEMYMERGWDIAGELRACSYFGQDSNFAQWSTDVEVALLKFVRLSDMLENSYPEVQARKVWLNTEINSAAFSVTPRAKVVSQCKGVVRRAKEYIDKLDRAS